MAEGRKAGEGHEVADGRSGRRRAMLGVVLVALVAAAGWWLTREAGPPPPPRASEVPLPDLSGAEAAVAERLRETRSAVFRTPGSPAAWGRYGMALDAHGWDRRAAAAYARAARQAPGEFGWAYHRGVALREAGVAGDSVLAAWRRAEELDEGYPPLYVRRGRLLYDRGEAEGAAAAFRRALELDPGSVAASLGLARVHLDRDAAEAAAEVLRAGLARAPRAGALHALLAEALERLGAVDEADLARWRSRIFPAGGELQDPMRTEILRAGASARLRHVRGQEWLARGDVEAAMRDFRAALEVRTDDAELWDDLGRALQAAGLPAEAADAHRRSLTLRPGAPTALVNLGAALFALGRVEDAIARVEDAIAADSSFAAAWQNLGMYELARGRQGAAAVAFAGGLGHVPFDPDLAIRLAWLRATSAAAPLRDGSEAVRLAEIVCRIGGFTVAEHLDVLAAAYAETGAWERAVVMAERAAALAAAAGRNRLERGIRARAALYRERRPYRE